MVQVIAADKILPYFWHKEDLVGLDFIAAQGANLPSHDIFFISPAPLGVQLLIIMEGGSQKAFSIDVWE